MGWLVRTTLISTVLIFSVAALAQTQTQAQTQQQQPATMSLQNSEALFDVMAAINACGYDQDVKDSLPLRIQIRAEVEHAATEMEAQAALEHICRFYEEHRQPEASRTLAQYISLALFLGDGPVFEVRGKEADLPPDAFRVLGFVPLLQNFYITTDLHKIWLSHLSEYNGLLDRYHGEVTSSLTETDFYLRRPVSGYLHNSFSLLIDPMIPPSQTNSRNYADDFFIIFSPSEEGIPLRQIRHTYLHYLLEPMMEHRGTTVMKLLPLLDSVKQAPLNESFHKDISLLMTESLIRAIEAHMEDGAKVDEAMRRKMVANDMAAGFILTRYFYDALTAFQRGDESLERAYPDWLYYIDVHKIQKEAAATTFAPTASPEVVSMSPHRVSMTGLAERALVAGNPDSAVRFANEALARKEDISRIHFVLARASILQGKLEEARTFFEQTISESKEAHILAWSHIYLGRICDMTENRDAALKHYAQALNSGDNTPALKAAAKKGMDAPFAPPARKIK